MVDVAYFIPKPTSILSSQVHRLIVASYSIILYVVHNVFWLAVVIIQLFFFTKIYRKFSELSEFNLWIRQNRKDRYELVKIMVYAEGRILFFTFMCTRVYFLLFDIIKVSVFYNYIYIIHTRLLSPFFSMNIKKFNSLKNVCTKLLCSMHSRCDRILAQRVIIIYINIQHL